MPNISIEVADGLVVRTINLMRLSVSERKKALKLLEQAKKELIGKLASEKLTELGRLRLKQLLIDTSATIDDAYKQINSGFDDTLGKLASHEAGATAKIMLDAGVSATLPSQAAISAIISDRLIMGAPSKDWWAKQSESLKFGFAQNVRQGITQGETTQQIISRVKGLFNARGRDVAALVHTSMQTVANDARLAVFKANDDVVKGLKQLSTLDGHTSDICISYSGAEWDLDGKPINGNDLPFNSGVPRHFSCRSVLTPILRKIEGLPESTRASDEGQISSKTTFTEFLSRKSPEYQDKLLGAGRAQLFRDGKITLRDLLDQKGRPLTLEQLKKL